MDGRSPTAHLPVAYVIQWDVTIQYPTATNMRKVFVRITTTQTSSSSTVDDTATCASVKPQVPLNKTGSDAGFAMKFTS